MSAVFDPFAGARKSASLLLLRDGAEGLEVLMMRRGERDADPRSGATVFPGGVLDRRDADAHACCLGLDDGMASARLGLATGGLDYYVAALRETFEEVGLLLADRVPEAAQLESWRQRVHRGEASIAELCRALDVRLDLRGLVYVAHWLTPPGHPKRFDTRFFAAPAPAAQAARADGSEAVELMWVTPRRALARETGLKLLPVTRTTLQELSQHVHSEAALQAQCERASVPLIMPRRASTARGPTVVLPWEPAYAEVGRLDPEGRADVAADLLPGRAVRLSERVRRVTAPNPGPMTGPGTNTYLVGDAAAQGPWTLIDPGPESAPHLQALLDAAGSRRIERILVTHTHLDHSPGAAALARATGAAVYGRRALHPERQDPTFAPLRELGDGERIACGEGTTLRVLHTPGHASNHLCYLLEEERLLFSGDHVMQGSTVVINPPDGDMAAYLAALQAVLALDLQWLAPGHGFLVADPHAAVRSLVAHRLRREAKVLRAVRERGPAPLAELLAAVYDDVPAALHGVAERSLLAHLLKLHAEGALRRDGEVWSGA